VYRNYAEFGVAGISSQSTVNFYSVLVPSVLAVENGTTWGEEFEALLARDAKDPNYSSIAEGREYVRKALPVLLGHPMALVAVSANTALNFFIHDGVYDVLRHLEVHPDRSLGGPALFLALKDPGTFIEMVIYYVQSPFALVLVGRVFWIAFTVLFVWGAFRYLMKKRKSAGIMALSIVLYFMLTTLVIGLAVNARYRLPVNVFIITFSLYGTMPIIEKLRSRYDV